MAKLGNNVLCVTMSTYFEFPYDILPRKDFPISPSPDKYAPLPPKRLALILSNLPLTVINA